ncbi:MAG: tetratricopeptide repeat protein [Anaerolineae bacterium]|nr:tetratricopeptide repeat protein [Anaerolineae bacterium]
MTAFAYNKVRALLAYLAVEAEHFHRRETLATLFWPDQTPKLARQNLRQSLATLRRAINDQNVSPPFLLIDGDTVQFNCSNQTWLDVADFRTHLEADGHVHPYPDIESCQSCIQHMAQAVALYKGEFLADLLLGDSVEFETWAIACRERFHIQALTALYHLTRHHLRRGEYNQAQTYALQQMELDPYREEAHRQLMRILACTGQRGAALTQYETCCRILSEELGAEPSRQTQALYKRIRSAGTRCPHNLPPQLTSLIGREGELQYLAEHLANPNCRLLILTGLGGIGKTRLALQSAQEHIGIFLHGVYFVPLAALSSSEFLASTIADALGLSFSGEEDPQTQLVNYLREKEILLVLDSFEHLLASPVTEKAGLDLLLEILKIAPEVKIMVTSRQRLNLQAEWVFKVQGLAFPQKNFEKGNFHQASIESYSAVQLFFKRARRVEREFSLSGATTATVGRICQLAEGMPLAIELAAASVATLSCEQIAAQIESSLDTLTTTMRDVPERHRSVRAVFKHSWQLLAEAEQRVFRKLTIFRGGFTAQAARQVAQATPEVLSNLINKSLLQQDASGRYGIHELLRQFAAEELNNYPAEKETALERRCTYYADFLHQRAAPLNINFHPEILAEIGVEIENIRAAWQWAVTQAKLEAVEPCLESLYQFYWARNWFHEGKQVFAQAEEVALAAGQNDSLLLAKIWTRQAEFESWLAHYDGAKIRLKNSIRVCRTLQEQDELALALQLLGRVHYWQGEHVPAKERFEESLTLYRQTDNKAGMALSLNNLANTIGDLSADYDQAQSLYQESLALAREIDDRFGIARALINQGAVAQEIGNYPEAQQLYRESLEVYQKIGYRYGQSAALNYLGQVTSLLGEHVAAKTFLQQSFDLSQETGDHRSMADCLKQLGNVACRMDAYPEAKEYFAEALNLVMEIQADQMALDILIGVANLFQQQGKQESALELLAFVIHQSQGSQERKNRAQALVPKCEAGLSPPVITRCRERGESQILAEIVAAVLAE